jgi:hypothetical protein
MMVPTGTPSRARGLLVVEPVTIDEFHCSTETLRKCPKGDPNVAKAPCWRAPTRWSTETEPGPNGGYSAISVLKDRQSRR